MKIGPELKSVIFSKPFHFSFTIYVPEITAARDEYYGDLDFSISAQTSLAASAYEYGYIFRIIVLGFGFEFWAGRGI